MLPFRRLTSLFGSGHQGVCKGRWVCTKKTKRIYLIAERRARGRVYRWPEARRVLVPGVRRTRAARAALRAEDAAHTPSAHPHCQGAPVASCTRLSGAKDKRCAFSTHLRLLVASPLLHRSKHGCKACLHLVLCNHETCMIEQPALRSDSVLGQLPPVASVER